MEPPIVAKRKLGDMSNLRQIALLVLSLVMSTACQRSTAGNDDDSHSESDTDSDMDTDADSDTDSDSDTGSDTDSDSDTDTGMDWAYPGSRQSAIGSIQISCDTAKLVAADCAPNAPSPCVPAGGKIICDMIISDSAGAEYYNGVVGIEQWGRGTSKYDKTNYEFEMRLSDGETENPAAVLGMGKEEDWILDGSWTDRSFMRSDLVRDIFKELGSGDTHVAADSRYVQLNFNGDSRGIYRLSERIKRDDDRVDIEADPSDFGENFIVKLDDDGEIDASIGAEEDDWLCVYPSEDKVTDNQRTGILIWLMKLSESMTKGEPFSRLNKTNVVDWVLINEFAKNLRTFDKGWYLFKSGDGKANLIPSDEDMSFGLPDTSAEGWTLHNQMTANLLKDATFKSALVKRWAVLRQGPLAEQALKERIDDYLKALPEEAIADNFGIWPMGNLDLSVVDATFTTPDVADFDTEIAALRQWITDRLAWVDDNIASYQ